MLSRTRKNGQVTIPARIRKAVRLEDGDFIDFEVADGKIVITPKKLIDSDQAWYWTEAWQAAEKEADLAIERGDVEEFENMEDAARFLRDRRK